MWAWWDSYLRKLCRLAILLGGVGSLHTSVFFSLSSNVHVYLREELLTVMKGARRCHSRRLHVPPRALPRIRIHLRAGQPDASGQLLHCELRRQIPAIRHAVHDLHHRRSIGCTEPADGYHRRTPVRLPHTHLADVWWRQELHLHTTGCEALVRRNTGNGAGQGLRTRCAGPWTRHGVRPAQYWTQYWRSVRQHGTWSPSWRRVMRARATYTTEGYTVLKIFLAERRLECLTLKEWLVDLEK